MLIPIRQDGDRNIYTLSSIHDYGEPEENGYHGKYEVIVENVDLSPRVNAPLDELLIKNKDIHRYDRYLRFRTILGQLTGHVGFVSKKALDDLDDIVEALPDEIYYTPEDELWQKTFKVLKRIGKTKYKNRIPAILQSVNLISPVNIHYKHLNSIYNDFKKLELYFPKVKGQLERRYFPSLRYVAIKMYKKYSNDLITIPHSNNFDKLDRDWEKIWAFIEEQEDELLVREIEEYI